MKTFLSLTFLGFILFSGCGPSGACDATVWGFGGKEFVKYEISHESFTLKGVAFDSSQTRVPAELIDRLVDETENCIGRKINRASFKVKIADDWELNCDKTQQTLPIVVNSTGCIDKGQDPTITCPCKFRAGIKCPNIIVTTPSMYLFKDMLIRFVVSVSNPWIDDALSICAQPSTDPLENSQ